MGKKERDYGHVVEPPSARVTSMKTMNDLCDCFSLDISEQFIQKLADISFETNANVAESYIFLMLGAWLGIKALQTW